MTFLNPNALFVVALFAVGGALLGSWLLGLFIGLLLVVVVSVMP